MRQTFPSHPIWTDPIFAREDYLAFVQELELSIQITEEPEEIRIRKTLPVLAQRLNVVQQSLEQLINDCHQTIKGMTQMVNKIEDLFNGHITFTMQMKVLSSITEDSIVTTAPLPHPSLPALSYEAQARQITSVTQSEYPLLTISSSLLPYHEHSAMPVLLPPPPY
jgi:hypothetical protein